MIGEKGVAISKNISGGTVGMAVDDAKMTLKKGEIFEIRASKTHGIAWYSSPLIPGELFGAEEFPFGKIELTDDLYSKENGCYILARLQA